MLFGRRWCIGHDNDYDCNIPVVVGNDEDRESFALAILRNVQFYVGEEGRDRLF